MNILAIDSATSVLSVAFSKNGHIFYKEDASGKRQSESCMLIIDEAVKEAGLTPFDLNGVICMGGPGSFTGLRIGYSIAKGLALSLNIPFASVPTIKEIKKEGGNYYYFSDGKPAKRGFARELLEIGMSIDFSDNTALFSGPDYN